MVSVGSIVKGSFAFVRNNPGIVAVWSVVYMVGSLIMSFFAMPLSRAQMQTALGQPLPPNFFSSLVMLYVVMIALFIILFAAIYRAVLRPDEHRAAYVRVGMDELRLLGMTLLLILIAVVAMIILTIVGFLVAIALGVMLGESGAASTMVLLYLLMMGLYVWAWVRISPAGALTILRGRLSLREAWRLTRGHFWALFGGYFVISLSVVLVFALIMFLTMGGYVSAMMGAIDDPVETARLAEAQMAIFAPGSLIWFAMLIGGGIVMGVALALQGAMVAIATRDLLATAEQQ